MDRLRDHLLTRRAFVVGTAGIAGSALLAACGDDDEETPTSTPETDQSTEPDSATPTQETEESEPDEATPTSESSESEDATPTSDSAEPSATEEASETATEETADGGGQTVAEQLDPDSIQQGGNVSFAVTGDIATMMPILITTSDTAWAVTGLMFETLVVPDPDTLQPAPRLAESWEVSADNLTYTFTLQPDVVWHDGEPFTADDVKFTFDTTANQESGALVASTLSNRVASVEVVDPQTVAITLNDVNAPFLLGDASVPILPVHLLGDVEPADLRTHPFVDDPVGTGPFMFEERRVGEYVHLVKNPNYYQGAPAIDEVVIRIGRDNTAVYQQLKTGEIDALAITPAFYEDAQEQSHLNLVLVPGFGFQYLGFNLDESKGSPILQDVKVRQALCFAINRDGIVENIENGLSEAAIGLYPSISWAHQPDQIELKYEYDPERAAELLEEAGWVMGSDGIREKDGQRLAVVMRSLSGSTRFEGFTAVIQDNWKDIGVELSIELEEFQAFITRLTSTHEYEIFILGTGASFDPDQTSLWASDQYPAGGNYVAYSNPRVDELLEQGVQTLDVDERTAIYVEMQNLVLADMPAFITTFTTLVHGVNKRLKNFIPNAVDTYAQQHAHLWYVTDDE